MDNRDEIYVVLDGNVDDLSAEGDLMYYRLLHNWGIEDGYKFVFSDSYKYRLSIDSEEKREQLEKEILEKMSKAKQMILIMTENSNWNQHLLNFEVDMAVDYFELPIIAVYPECRRVTAPGELKGLWPQSFYKKVINPSFLRCIHVPFSRSIIGDALDQFHVHSSRKLKGPLVHYSKKVYDNWGL